MKTTNNLAIWNALKTVPKASQKTIQAGRLKGMTDIKPQWRYQVMTEQFGTIGFGWYYEITKQWLEDGSHEQKCAFVNVNLFIKVNDEWSNPIQGTGGNSFIANERNGLYTSDECFKMALTDALSVAMSKIGVGAEIYLGENSGGKYTQPPVNSEDSKPWLNESNPDFKKIKDAINNGSRTMEQLRDKFKVSKEIETIINTK